MHYLSEPLVHFLLFLSTAAFVEEQKHSFDAILVLYYVFFNALYTILQCEISLPNIVLHNVVTGNFPFLNIYVKFVTHIFMLQSMTCVRLLLEMFCIFYTGLCMHLFVCVMDNYDTVFYSLW